MMMMMMMTNQICTGRMDQWYETLPQRESNILDSKTAARKQCACLLNCVHVIGKATQALRTKKISLRISDNVFHPCLLYTSPSPRD